jgi:hypothetical protein
VDFNILNDNIRKAVPPEVGSLFYFLLLPNNFLAGNTGPLLISFGIIQEYD